MLTKRSKCCHYWQEHLPDLLVFRYIRKCLFKIFFWRIQFKIDQSIHFSLCTKFCDHGYWVIHAQSTELPVLAVENCQYWRFCQYWHYCQGGVQVYLVIGDWAQKLVVIWWFEPKKCGDLVILRSCGDGDLAQKSMVIWWF